MRSSLRSLMNSSARLCISTQCGFASVWEGNPLTEEASRRNDLHFYSKIHHSVLSGPEKETRPCCRNSKTDLAIRLSLNIEIIAWCLVPNALWYKIAIYLLYIIFECEYIFLSLRKIELARRVWTYKINPRCVKYSLAKRKIGLKAAGIPSNNITETSFSEMSFGAALSFQLGEKELMRRKRKELEK